MSTTNHADDRQAQRLAELCVSDQQIRDATPVDEITAAIRQPGTPLVQIVATVMDGYANRPALGERAKELVTDPATGRKSLRLLPEFDLLSYRALWARVGAVAAEWHHNFAYSLRAGAFVGTLGFTSSDYATIDLACVRLGAVCVPLQVSASAGNLRAIIEETRTRILASSVELLDTGVRVRLRIQRVASAKSAPPC